jgi:hypothetical protein
MGITVSVLVICTTFHTGTGINAPGRHRNRCENNITMNLKGIVARMSSGFSWLRIEAGGGLL